MTIIGLQERLRLYRAWGTRSFGGNFRLWRGRALSRLPAYSDRARPAYGELFRRIRRAFPVVGACSAYGEVFRCMGYVMPSLRARPARVGSFENSAFRFGSLSDCPAHVGICSAAGACALWALGSSRLCEEVGTEPHGSAAALGSPRPCGEVSYSGTSSEFSRGSTSLVRESSGKMSPTPSASGVLPPMWGSWAGRSEASFRSGMLSAHVGEYAI